MWRQMTKPQIRCGPIQTAAGLMKFVVWTPHRDGYPRPRPAHTWQDALDVVADWYAGRKS
jgi:hypothetical protein